MPSLGEESGDVYFISSDKTLVARVPLEEESN